MCSVGKSLPTCPGIDRQLALLVNRASQSTIITPRVLPFGITERIIDMLSRLIAT
jgi:hypothetical protein